MKIRLLLATLLFCSFSGALLAQPSLGLTSATTTSGNPASLALTLAAGDSQPTALQWTLGYPASSVSAFTVTAGPALTAAGKSLLCGGTADAYMCMAYGLNQVAISDGVVAVVSMTPVSNASSVPVAVSQGLGSSLSGGAIPFAATSGTLSVTLPAAAASSVSALTCATTYLSPNSSLSCSVTISQAAPSGGVAVALSSSNASISVPASVNVPANGTSASFTVTAGAFTPPQSATITASSGTTSQSALLALVYPGVLSSITCSPSMIYGGATGTCAVKLASAVAGGTTVLISSSNSLLHVPASVTVPANGSAASFAFTADSKLSGSAILTATLGPASTTFAFSVTTDTTPPTISLTTPQSGTTLAQTVTLTANATCSLGLSNVQFQLDGANLGSPVTGAGPWFTFSWNTQTAADGPHVLSAVAYNIAGIAGTSSKVSITVANGTGPVISNLTATSITSSAATITWSTSTNADSQVGYGTSASQQILSALNSTLTTLHSITLTGLQPSTGYYYQALSRDAQGHLTRSASLSFSTLSSSGAPVVFQLHSDASEVSGTTNGSIVTPAVTPAGFTGKVVVTSGGSINFAPGSTGNGVYFLKCCANTTNAYYKFTGQPIGNIFNMDGGQISFYLTSRYSFAQRQQAGSFRVAFDVRDDNTSSHVFYFLTEIMSGRLIFSYRVGSTAQFYYVPQGTEDALFGNGVTAKVSMQWDGAIVRLYLNDKLVQSATYQSVPPNWTSASVFDIGAQEYLNLGGYNSLDDIIDEFTVTGH